ncbi:hypothetical protein H5410_060731 [Solanum commersonii]|uniref:Uncharacterized protein n=1 Tax=Solanum commersonii TaxID=4109 RepID=A0A9J5W5V3_SOLCO|nr:hypothetical protein H5410_060731 [Solanum commersonii]
MFRCDDGVSYFPVIGKWIEFVVNKKAYDQPYRLPEVLCSSSLIIKLNCTNCRTLEECILSWTYLKSLTLKSLLILDEHIKQIMSNFP